MKRKPAAAVSAPGALKRKPAVAPVKKKRPTAVLKASAPKLPERLRHRYFALRHGESEANVAGLIISDPKVGTSRYGLTQSGRDAVARTAQDFCKMVLDEMEREGKCGSGPVVMMHSDFSRTTETAQVFMQTVDLTLSAGARRMLPVGPAACKCKELRERFFGSLEAGPNNRYEEVWAKDRQDPTSRPFCAESAAALQQRTWRLVKRLEKNLVWDNCLVVLASHGDALQLLQSAFQGLSPAAHRELPHLNPAELRELRLPAA